MSVIKTTLDVDNVNYEESFTCMIDVSLSSLNEEITSAYVKLFIPKFIEFNTSNVQKPIEEIRTEQVEEGTNVTFDFGTNIDEGTATQVEIVGKFKLEASPDESYEIIPELYVNDKFDKNPSIPSKVNLLVKPNFKLSTNMVLPEIDPASGGEVYFCVSLENFGDLGAELKNVVIRIPAPTSPEGVTIDPTYTPAGFDESSSSFKDTSQDGNIAVITDNELVFNLSSFKGTKYSFFYKMNLPENADEGEEVESVAYWTYEGKYEEGTEFNSFTISEPIYDVQLGSYGPTYTTQNELFNYTHNIANTGNQILNDVYMNVGLDDAIKYTNIKTGTFQLMGIKELTDAEYHVDYTTINNKTGRMGPFSTQKNESVDLSKYIADDDNLSSLAWNFDSFGIGVETRDALEINGRVRDNIEADSRILNRFEITWEENKELQTKGANVMTGTGVTDLCILDPIASSLTSYKVIPGEIIRYKIGADCLWSRLKNPILAMFLPNQLTYAGNETFSSSDYFAGNSGGPENPKIEVIENFNNTDQTLVKFMYNHDFSQRSALDIEFDTKVKIGAIGEIETQLMLNSTDNIGEAIDPDEIFEGDIGEPSINTPYALSKIVKNKIELFASIDFDIKVKGELDKDFIGELGTAKTPEAGNVEYITTLSNIGNANFTSIEIVGILPYIGDKGVIQVDSPRGSEFVVSIVNDITSDNGTIMYSESVNPIRFGSDLQIIGENDDWKTTLPSEATNVKAFKLVKNTILKPNESIEFKIYATTPSGVPLNSIAYNSFAAKMQYEDEDGIKQFLLPVEAPRVGVEVLQSDEDAVRLSGRIWLANKVDDQYDSSKQGINDVGIALFDEEGKVFSTDFTTDNFDKQSGVYMFSNVPKGKYRMKLYIDTLEYVVLAQDNINQGGITPLIDINEDVTINIALKLRKKIPSILDVNRSSRDMIRNVLYSQLLTQMKLEDIKEMI